MDLEDTIVAISSPPGAAVRGIVRLSGPAAVTLAERVFDPHDRPALSGIVENSCVAGRLRLGPDELPAFCIVFRGPGSYTGQDVVELHMLGAPGVLGLTVEALLAAGANSRYTYTRWTVGFHPLSPARPVEESRFVLRDPS